MSSNQSNARRPVVLCVLDGWGHREDGAHNAIAEADTPVYDRLMQTVPRAMLSTSGTDVGLPAGQMGNSEVGHLNLGAGRVVNQEIRRIDAAREDGSLASNPVLCDFVDTMKKSGGRCHLMGLLSPGGVHSHQDHMVDLARVLDAAGIEVMVHAFLDGRDTPPKSAAGFVADFEADIASLDCARIATVTGRYYAMDRDQRWERVSQGYEAIVSATGTSAENAAAAIAASYEADITDEFVEPAIIDGFAGAEDGDGFLMANFRADRAREILSALLDPDFEGFKRTRTVAPAGAVGMVEYSEGHNRFLKTLFPPLRMEGLMGGVVADAGLRQLRIAETEKYAHVTFFFNGGEETPFPGEERILIPSPKVATYDLQPEMSAAEVTDKLVEAIGSGRFDFIFVNYANPDMVGHTGILSAAVTAIETVDRCLARLEEAVTSAGGTLLITADHGNAETMQDPETGAPHTAHTTNLVPALLVNAPETVAGIENGKLADVAPTLLALMGLPQPQEMTGTPLIALQLAETGTARVSA